MEKSFRRNAAAVVFRSDKKVLVCARIKGEDNSWQFPQGGIEDEETPREAATRELYEETSLRHVKWIAGIDKPIRYEFPPEIKEAFRKKGIVTDGQDHYWSLFFLEGSETEINLQTAEPEFKAYRWVDIEETPNLVWCVKKDDYAQMVKVFAPLIQCFQPD